MFNGIAWSARCPAVVLPVVVSLRYKQIRISTQQVLHRHLCKGSWLEHPQDGTYNLSSLQSKSLQTAENKQSVFSSPRVCLLWVQSRYEQFYDGVYSGSALRVLSILLKSCTNFFPRLPLVMSCSSIIQYRKPFIINQSTQHRPNYVTRKLASNVAVFPQSGVHFQRSDEKSPRGERFRSVYQWFLHATC